CYLSRPSPHATAKQLTWSLSCCSRTIHQASNSNPMTGDHHMTTTTQTASDVSQEIARVFALQQENQWNVKASTAAQRKAKLAKLKAAVEQHADAIVAA